MPTHCHLLIKPHDPACVSAVLYGLKKSVTNRALAWARRHRPASLARMADRTPNGQVCHRFWQRGGGHDRNIYGPREIRQKISYIHANPVRSGLVDHPAKWFWSSYRAWETGEDVPMAIDRHTLPPLPL